MFYIVACGFSDPGRKEVKTFFKLKIYFKIDKEENYQWKTVNMLLFFVLSNKKNASKKVLKITQLVNQN